MGFVNFGVEDKKSTRALADPLDQSAIIGAMQKGVDTVKGIGASAAGDLRRFGPFINHGQGKTQFGGDLLGTTLLEDFPQDLVRLHEITMGKGQRLGKAEAEEDWARIEASITRDGQVQLCQEWSKESTGERAA